MPGILIIEDDEQSQRLLKRFLEKKPLRVFQAYDGNQGIRLYREHQPDIVITDLIMPEKEGIEAIRELKSINPDVKIIAISGGGRNHPEDYLKVAVRLGAACALEKPISRDHLIRAIDSLLNA